MNMIDDPTNRKYGTHKEFLIKFVNVLIQCAAAIKEKI